MNAETVHNNPFERIYLEVRQMEGRLYPDEVVAKLPDIDRQHHFHKEWRIRKASCRQLVRYLVEKKTPLRILEIGCGNGWLAHQLSFIPGSVVIGTDVQITELQQAARVFSNRPNLHFMFGPPDQGLFEKQQVDIIVFAASIQYFPSLKDIIEQVLPLLKNDGEIHIIDSPLYKQSECEQARQRSQDYFDSLGFGQMAHYYFHHCMGALAGFNYRLLYRPLAGRSLLRGNRNPFPWICITHQQ